MDADFRCILPSFHECRTKDDDIITQSLEEQVDMLTLTVASGLPENRKSPQINRKSPQISIM